mmetsp:Transcript_13249/g.53456  ORF Transcript_13249/g.53456 Transcript_13249/m.53456 type:complete len:429 (+) Transcript_13249:1255-2541(+)
MRGDFLLGGGEREVADEQAAGLGDRLHVLRGDLLDLRLVVLLRLVGRLGFLVGGGRVSLLSPFLADLILADLVLVLVLLLLLRGAGIVLQVVDALHVTVELAVLVPVLSVLAVLAVLVVLRVAKVLCRFSPKVVEVVELVVVGVVVDPLVGVRLVALAVVGHLPPRLAPLRLRLRLFRLLIRLGPSLSRGAPAFLVVIGVADLLVLVVVGVAAGCVVIVKLRRRLVLVRRDGVRRTFPTVVRGARAELTPRRAFRLHVSCLVIPHALLRARRHEPHELGQLRIRGDGVVDLLLEGVLLRALHLLELAHADEPLGVGRLGLPRRALLRGLVRPAVRGRSLRVLAPRPRELRGLDRPRVLNLHPARVYEGVVEVLQRLDRVRGGLVPDEGHLARLAVPGLEDLDIGHLAALGEVLPKTVFFEMLGDIFDA